EDGIRDDLVTGVQKCALPISLFLQLATGPHPNAEVALAALAQVDGRTLKVTAEQLAPLCQHHRTRLREAARALNARLGFPPPPRSEERRVGNEGTRCGRRSAR